MLALDPVYGQGVGELLAAEALPAGVTWSALPVVPLVPPFARRSMPGRWWGILRRWRAVAAAAGDPAAVVVGVDGAFERVLLARQRRRGGPTAMLWDGLPAHPPAADAAGPGDGWQRRRRACFLLRRRLLRLAARPGLDALVPGLVGHAPLDVIYVMGELAARRFREQRVAARVEVTGMPRFAPLLRRPPAGPPAPGRVLYLTGAYRWHDEPGLDEHQRRDLDRLATALPATGWELAVRVHPREEAAAYRDLAARPGVRVTLAAATPLLEDLAAAEVVVTVTSMAALEALALGRPVVRFLGSFPRSLADVGLGDHPGLPVVTEVGALLAELARLRREPPDLARTLADFVAPCTAEAPARISGALLAAMAAGDR